MTTLYFFRLHKRWTMSNSSHLERRIQITDEDLFNEIKEKVKGHKEINVYYEMKFASNFYLFENCKFTLTPFCYKDFDDVMVKGGILVLTCGEIKTIDTKIIHRKLKLDQLNNLNETSLEV